MTRIRLLVIDPQNDFMDIAGAALAVSGAQADMARLAAFIDDMDERIADLIVTLDSHASVGIERSTFWLAEDGAAVAPFSAISAADVRARKFRPRDAALAGETLVYLDALEAAGERTLVAWPVHCVLGTWGHNMAQPLAQSVGRWELARGHGCEKVLKGLNPMTEQYSAFRADVPRADDPRSANNTALMERLGAGDEVLVVAGEALSHCVAASVQDMLAQMPPARLANTILLSDCMSPVSGFEAAGAQFLQQARDHGVRTLSAAEARRSLCR